MSNIAAETWSYLTTGTNWTGTADVDGLGLLIGQHLQYTVIAVAVAAVVAVVVTGAHTRFIANRGTRDAPQEAQAERKGP